MSAFKVLFLFMLGHLLCDVYGQRENKFFRKDYKYIDSTKSFYKIHTIHKNWKDAKKVCASEGASLFYPEDTVEAEEIVKIMKKNTPFHWVYVGVSDVLSRGVFETIDGVPIDNVYNKWDSGEPNGLYNQNCVILRLDGLLRDDDCNNLFPFVCKKTLDSLQWNTHCNMPFMDYEYNEALGKCYKFHLNPLNWTDAYAACSAELSYLAIINSQPEANEIANITARAPKDNVQGNYLRGAVHLGFHNRDDEGWQTIKGVPLADCGYSVWSPNQPDGRGNEKCGSMFYNGQLNDIGCEQRMFFICEHDIVYKENREEKIDPSFNIV